MVVRLNLTTPTCRNRVDNLRAIVLVWCSDTILSQVPSLQQLCNELSAYLEWCRDVVLPFHWLTFGYDRGHRSIYLIAQMSEGIKPCLCVVGKSERRVFLQHELQSFIQRLLVHRRLRLDTAKEDWLWNRHSLQFHRLVWLRSSASWYQRVSCVCCL